MSCFTETLKALMALNEPPLTGASLAKKTKLSEATVSRLMCGQVPASEHVALFCEAISPKQERRVELLLAHLRDVVQECKSAGIDECDVVVAAPKFGASGKTLGAELQLIGNECAKHEDVRAIVSGLARTLARH